MPKRSFDLSGFESNLPLDKTQRKTERSHEENQERAYIAASRRADRSIEARVQSARMASEIHKKRTGKAFRISEEIVMKEEMYEEEEDEFPRSYRLLGPHMQTSSAEMNSRVESYLSNRVAMSKLLTATEEDWRDNEINRAFAQMFPNANRQAQSLSQRWSVPGYPAPTQQSGRLQSPVDSSFEPNFQQINYGQDMTNERSHSMASISPIEAPEGRSTPALTPGSGVSHPQTPHSREASVFGGVGMGVPQNVGPEFLGSDGSPFTTELPAEAKMMLGGTGLHDTFSQPMYSQDWNTAPSFYGFGSSDVNKPIKSEMSQDSYMPSYGEFEPLKWDPSLQAPVNAPEEPSWDSFINDSAWTIDQQ